MKDTVKYALPPAVMVGAGVVISVSSGDMWKTIVGMVFAGAIFYVLYSMLDRNPASEDEAPDLRYLETAHRKLSRGLHTTRAGQ